MAKHAAMLLALVGALIFSLTSAFAAPLVQLQELASVDSDSVTVRGVSEIVTERGTKAFSFDGDDSLVVVLPASQATGEVSVAGWFFTKSLQADGRESTGSWVSRRNSYILSPNTDGSVSFWVFIGNYWYVATTASNLIQLNTWEHWAGTYDGNVIRIYQNGALVAEKEARSTEYARLGNTGAVCVGADCGIRNRFFQGDADEILIDNHALSASEIRSLHASQRGLFYQGMIVTRPMKTAPTAPVEHINAALNPAAVTKVERITDTNGKVTGWKEVTTGKVTSLEDVKRLQDEKNKANKQQLVEHQVIKGQGIYTVSIGDRIEWNGVTTEIREISWALQGDTQPKVRFEADVAQSRLLHEREGDFIYRGPVTQATKVYYVYVISIEKNEQTPSLSKAKIAVVSVD